LVLSAQELADWKTSKVENMVALIDQTTDQLQKKMRRFSKKRSAEFEITGENLFSKHAPILLYSLLNGLVCKKYVMNHIYDLDLVESK
jgi:hypothetical protein